jgi:hypothetical protein
MGWTNSLMRQPDINHERLRQLYHSVGIEFDLNRVGSDVTFSTDGTITPETSPSELSAIRFTP